MAGDAVNLFVIVPVLLVTAILAYRGSLPAKLIWLGTLLCILYSSIFYALAVHFNQLFFVYCGVLGFSFYAIAGSLSSVPLDEIADKYGPRAPVKTTAVFLLASRSSLPPSGWGKSFRRCCRESPRKRWWKPAYSHIRLPFWICPRSFPRW